MWPKKRFLSGFPLVNMIWAFSNPYKGKLNRQHLVKKTPKDQSGRADRSMPCLGPIYVSPIKVSFETQYKPVCLLSELRT